MGGMTAILDWVWKPPVPCSGALEELSPLTWTGGAEDDMFVDIEWVSLGGVVLIKGVVPSSVRVVGGMR